jgi:primase-polymerase (primpol)-like protein
MWRPVWDAQRSRWTKPPFQPNGWRASHSNPRTWVTFARAQAAYQRDGWAGIGYVLAPDDHLTGIDLDHCREITTGAIAAWALKLVKRFASYTEISPSGNGLRLFIAAKLRASGRKRGGFGSNGSGAIEIYDRNRYLTLTGRTLKHSVQSIAKRQRALDAIMREFFPDQVQLLSTRAIEPPAPCLRDDAAVVAIAIAARTGERFRALYFDGDLTAYDGDASRADFALLHSLLFYSGGDIAQTERLFSASALGLRAKWCERADYRAKTIAKALAGMTEFYNPSYYFGALLKRGVLAGRWAE